MMKIDEERQELILSNGRRVDMHYVDDFLIKYTDSDIDSYIHSKTLVDELYYMKEAEECKDLIYSRTESTEDGFLNRLRELLNNSDQMKKDFQELKKSVEPLQTIEERHEKFKNKMREFLIDWGTYLKNIQSSLSLSKDEMYQIESITDILFDFDFENE